MTDAECVAFLQWALPRLRLRWAGFRKVRRQVRRRIGRRIEALGLDGVAAYRHRLESDRSEWAVLDSLCRIPISRFLRDRTVFERLVAGLPERARCWSAGCASGEEPYTLSILGWERRARLEVVATDVDEALLARARAAVYARSSLRELPGEWIARAFEPCGEEYRLRPEYRRGVAFLRQDIREELPEGPFDAILCRNLVFTYFDEALQRELLAGLRSRLGPGGRLLIGAHESLPGERAEVPSC